MRSEGEMAGKVQAAETYYVAMHIVSSFIATVLFSTTVAACGAAASSTAGATTGQPEPLASVEDDPGRDDEGIDGDHAAVSDATCKGGDLCELSGHCTGSRRGCIVASESDCSASKQCKTDGACALGEGECVAKTKADCKQSVACRREYRCTVRDGYCIKG